MGATVKRIDHEILRSALPIHDVLHGYGCEIVGRNRTRCPLCHSSNPQAFSFTRDVWHCFRCGAGGDVFALIQALDGCSFPEAVTRSARIAGMSVDDVSALDAKALERRQTIARRRAALKQWRNERLTEWCLLIGDPRLHSLRLRASPTARPPRRGRLPRRYRNHPQPSRNQRRRRVTRRKRNPAT